MDVLAAPAVTPTSRGRLLLWLGVLTGLSGPILYFVQMMAGNLAVPWYAPALAALGAGLIVLSLLRRCTAWRIVALVLVGGLLAGEGWFLLSYTRLPPYQGPVAVGKPFPAFTAARADSTPFTAYNLQGDQDTVLVFYRGWW